MSRSFIILLVLAAGVALGLRCFRLSERPMHNDEAVNAIKFGQLWENGRYQYDPNEHHGPTLYFATLALGKLSVAPDFDHYTEARLRLVTVLFGVGVILLLPLLVDGLGRSGTLWAALFTAVSPAFAFYSPYFIHEMLLVFFTLLALAAGWRYWRSRKPGWIMLLGAALAFMVATKETFIITLGAAALALALNQTWNRLIDASGPPLKAPPLNVRHLLAAFFVFIGVAVVLFTSFLTNPRGLLDFFRGLLGWLNRGVGESLHVHPWYFYLERLLFFHHDNGPVWTEGLIMLLAWVAAVEGFRRQRLAGANASFVRFLAWYAFLLTAFYSLIAWKTPWCALNFWQPMILLAGIGAAVLLASAQFMSKAAIGVLLLVGVGHLGWQAWRAETEFAADPRNPYVYAQTLPDTLELARGVQALTAVSPEGERTVIQVMAPEDDYWPLPWYLRQFRQVGWWNKVPQNPYAPIMIISPRLEQPLDETKAHLFGFYGLRPQVRLALFVEPSLWEKWRATQSKPPAHP